MATNTNFEYENEATINENLKCSICNDPLMNPVETPCHHTFCSLCLNRWFDVSKSTCPTCRQSIGKHNIKQITIRSFLSMLDQLQVKCQLCQQSNIERGNFQDHLGKQCSQVQMHCTAKDFGCQWTGLREELLLHSETCTFISTEMTSQQLPVVPVSAPLNESLSIFIQRRNPDHTVTMCVDPEISNVLEETLVQATIQLIINKQCNDIVLCCQRFSSTSLSLIAATLTSDCVLQCLDLSACSIDDTGIQAFTNSLPTNSCLKVLNLYANLINDNGVKSIVNMLKSNKSLTRLVLTHNRIGNDGIQFLTDLFYYHDVQLKELSIGSNYSITDACVSSILTWIRWRRNLTLLKIDDTKMSYYASKLITTFYKLYFFSNLRLIL